MPNLLRTVEILLVEDSPTDRLIAVEAFKQAKIINSFNVVENGVEAMAYLRREGKFAAVLRPDLILLDLNLPKKDGREVLEEIKTDPSLKLIPVVVLTTSKAEEDILQAYGHHANSFITKPVDFLRFTQVICALENYWFEIVTLPQEAAVKKIARPTVSRPAPPPTAMEQVVRVLLVEDNPVDALLVRESLKESKLVKFELTVVERQADLQAQLHAEEFDVILTDLGLPDTQGLETYRQIRASAAELPIIVLTGFDDETTGISALREGAQDYLVKNQLTGRALARAVRYAIDKKNIEDQLRQSQRMDLLGKLAAGVAHDFNNLLTIIQGRAGLLVATWPADGKSAESIQEIKDAADRAADLTRQLLTFSRQQVIEKKVLDLNEAIGKIGKMLRRILGDDIRLELQLAANVPAVLADVGMLEQIILNFAINARDAMPGGGKLTVRTESVEVGAASSAIRHPDAYAGQFACLTVSDTGSGIAPEILPHIFEPFFTTKDVGKGTGLGLATVYGIVQQHRGWIHVTSQLTAGTSFAVFLPATTENPASASPPLAATVPSSGTETILLVEDENGVREMLKLFLEMNGYRVLEAQSGAEALAVWAGHAGEIDVLLTDMIMPGGKSGRQLAEELRGTRPALKVIFTSGYSKDFMSTDFVLKEGLNFLQKPYDLGKFMGTLRACLDAKE